MSKRIVFGRVRQDVDVDDETRVVTFTMHPGVAASVFAAGESGVLKMRPLHAKHTFVVPLDVLYRMACKPQLLLPYADTINCNPVQIIQDSEAEDAGSNPAQPVSPDAD
jgi:hypothetical protein